MRHLVLPAAFALLIVAPAAHAQTTGKLVITPYESTEVMLLRASASSRCQQNCIVRNAPYAAERLTESVQVLADGNRIVGNSTEQLYRDGEGRTRVESDWQGRALVQIQDPVVRMSYRLYPDDRTGLRMAIGAPAPVTHAASSALVQSGGDAVKVAQQLAPVVAGSVDSQTSKRSLGTRQIEGMMAEGTLETTTIPAGKFGNALPIVSTIETWTSPELKLALYVKSVDPRYGERVTRVQNVQRVEPPARLFEAPADYTTRQIAR